MFNQKYQIRHERDKIENIRAYLENCSNGLNEADNIRPVRNITHSSRWGDARVYHIEDATLIVEFTEMLPDPYSWNLADIYITAKTEDQLKQATSLLEEKTGTTFSKTFTV